MTTAPHQQTGPFPRRRTSVFRERSDSELVVTVHREGRWTVLKLVGDLDLTTVAPFEEHLNEHLGEVAAQGARPAVALDLSLLAFCDSSGLSAFVRAWRAIKEADGRLILVGCGDQPARLLNFTGLDRRLPIHQALPD